MLAMDLQDVYGADNGRSGKIIDPINFSNKILAPRSVTTERQNLSFFELSELGEIRNWWARADQITVTMSTIDSAN